MGCNDSLDVVSSAAQSGEPAVIVHRLTGGFIIRAGDAQLRADRHLYRALDGSIAYGGEYSYLYRFHHERASDGSDVYRIQTHLGTDPQNHDQFYVTINADIEDPGADGIHWEKWYDSGKYADAQRWHIVPACEGGVALVPYYARTYALGIIGRQVIFNCVRPTVIFYNAYIPLLNTWEIVFEKQLDIVQASNAGR